MVAIGLAIVVQKAVYNSLKNNPRAINQMIIPSQVSIFKVKATNFEKKFLPVLTKQLFLLSSVETNGMYFQIFVAFSEKLDFMMLFLLTARMIVVSIQSSMILSSPFSPSNHQLFTWDSLK